MARWQSGEADIEEMVGANLVDTDTHSAYVLAYDAARFACNALLAQQGLRATTSGGHYAVERAVRAQFGQGFRTFGDLRRRRNELEYSRIPGDAPTADEVKQAVDEVQRIIAGADRLIGALTFFTLKSAPT